MTIRQTVECNGCGQEQEFPRLELPDSWISVHAEERRGSMHFCGWDCLSKVANKIVMDNSRFGRFVRNGRRK